MKTLHIAGQATLLRLLTAQFNARSEVFKADVLESQVLWVVMPCQLCLLDTDKCNTNLQTLSNYSSINKVKYRKRLQS